jgi:hypothetical protein
METVPRKHHRIRKVETAANAFLAHMLVLKFQLAVERSFVPDFLQVLDKCFSDIIG